MKKVTTLEELTTANEITLVPIKKYKKYTPPVYKNDDEELKFLLQELVSKANSIIERL